METIIFHPETDKNAIVEAAAILRRGGLLGIPTETVYGLGAVFGKQGDGAALRPGGLTAAGGLRPEGAVQRRKGVGNGADALVIGNGCDLA